MKNTRPLNPDLFRDKAEILGCQNVDELGDLAVWNYILKAQGKPEIDV